VGGDVVREEVVADDGVAGGEAHLPRRCQRERCSRERLVALRLEGSEAVLRQPAVHKLVAARVDHQRAAVVGVDVRQRHADEEREGVQLSALEQAV